jgi:hypothetical protein
MRRPRQALTRARGAAQGEHPLHRGLRDAERLGTVERYFVEVMGIPRLQQRIRCFICSRTFAPALQRVRARGEAGAVSAAPRARPAAPREASCRGPCRSARARTAAPGLLHGQ